MMISVPGLTFGGIVGCSVLVMGGIACMSMLGGCTLGSALVVGGRSGIGLSGGGFAGVRWGKPIL